MAEDVDLLISLAELAGVFVGSSTLWRARASNMANLKFAFPDYYLVRPAHFRARRRRLCKGGV